MKSSSAAATALIAVVVTLATTATVVNSSIVDQLSAFLVLGNVIPNVPAQNPAALALSKYNIANLTYAINKILQIGSDADNALLKVIAQGVTLPTGSLLYNDISIGAVTLPPGYLCSNQSLTNVVANLTLVTSCYVCSADCTWVHNKYGGFCGIQTNPASNQYQKTSVCVCGDTQDGDIKTPYQQCGPLLANIPQFVNDIAGLLIQFALLGRENAQCVVSPTNSTSSGSLTTYNSASCQVDCQTNHQYSCGICDKEIPVPLKVGDTNTQERAFCGCYYGETAGNNGTQCITTPTTPQ